MTKENIDVRGPYETGNGPEFMPQRYKLTVVEAKQDGATLGNVVGTLEFCKFVKALLKEQK